MRPEQIPSPGEANVKTIGQTSANVVGKVSVGKCFQIWQHGTCINRCLVGWPAGGRGP